MAGGDEYTVTAQLRRHFVVVNGIADEENILGRKGKGGQPVFTLLDFAGGMAVGQSDQLDEIRAELKVSGGVFQVILLSR